MNEGYEMYPIGVIESCYGEKFGTPRQSGIVPGSFGKVVFTDAVDPQASRGLEEFSHVWLLFLFDQVKEEDVRWLVRPPRLGGNEKKGVFATRSPFRPNRMGLSLVKLEEVTENFLTVSGVDLINGTPILDVKPYLPYVESRPDAVGGFAEKTPQKMAVSFPDLLTEEITPEVRQLICESLALDPRPAYHDDPDRIYGCQIADFEVKWQVIERRVNVLSMTRFDHGEN